MQETNKDSCVFCKIIKKLSPADIVFENKDFLCFLDVRPLFLGHCLLVPKQHFEHFYVLPDELNMAMFLLAKKIGKGVEQAMQADGSLLIMNNKVSQSVLHVHLHLIPRKYKDGLKGFFWPRLNYADAAHSKQVSELISEKIKLLN